MTKIHRNGFTQVGIGKEGIKTGLYQFNIIFVHGLRGHPQRTWGRGPADDGDSDDNKHDYGRSSKRPNESRAVAPFKFLFRRKRQEPTTRTTNDLDPLLQKPFWPEEFLATDIPEARIWTYGYNADVIEGVFQANNGNSISQHGRDLAVQFDREIDNDQPVVFIAHSLGGIVVKDAIRRSKACQSRTRLIIFLGTPHRGSSYAGWGKTASNLVRLVLQDSNKKIVETLEVNSEVLDNIQEEFKQLADIHRFKIHSFQEARAVSGIKGLNAKVVDDFSSKVDLPSTLETVESIDADHRQMVKCTSKDDDRYRAILGVLKQSIRSGHLWAASVVSSQPQTPTYYGQAHTEAVAPGSSAKANCNPVHMYYGNVGSYTSTSQQSLFSIERRSTSFSDMRSDSGSSTLYEEDTRQVDMSLLSQQRKEQIRLHLLQRGPSPSLGSATKGDSQTAHLEIVLFHVRTFYTRGNFDPTPKVLKPQFWKDVANSIYFFKVSDLPKARRLLQDTAASNSSHLFTQGVTTMLIEILSTLSSLNTAANPDVRKTLLRYLNLLAAKQLPRENPIAFILRSLHEGMDSADWSLQALTFIVDRLCTTLEPPNELRLLAQHRLIALLRRGGHSDQALRACKAALGDIRSVLGPGSLQERKTARHLEHIYIDQEDWVSALDVCFDIVGHHVGDSVSPNPDPQHHDECSVWTMEDIAKIYECTGNLGQAIAWLKQARISGGIVWGGKVALEHIQDKLIELLTKCGKTAEADSNTSILKPGCVVAPKSTTDVLKIVKVLVKYLYQFAVKSGGHNANPSANSINRGVSIDLGGLNAASLARDHSNISFTGGICENVGIGGVSLGGGQNLFQAQRGWVIDNILNYKVVLASGQVVNANSKSYTDLFKALKGGNTNFSIITNIKLAAFDFQGI
ncbi:FAD-dependent monooxygenase prx3 [Cladobotryum mycophilum]|uniref:FAD-dependent monooxygenase prx3 n=1 Tax=Cladobotryum mycophilum TaxID=491253 RepID=A0ABR0SPS1_9HYPO